MITSATDYNENVQKIHKLMQEVINLLISKQRQVWSDNFWAYLFIAPQILGLLAFTLFPVLASFYLCFARWDFIKPPQWVGFANFTAVFGDPVFGETILNTIVLVFSIVPLTMMISLFLAMLTNRQISGLNFYKAAFFLPMVTSSVAIAMAWYWLYAPDFGLINTVLSLAGIPGPGWLADPAWAKVAVIIMAAWQGMGYYYVIFLAGLKNIPADYYEAADIDGASPVHKFFSITLPMLSPVTFFILITLMINAFNMFSEIYVLTRGGPIYSTYTMVMYIYYQAFQFFQMGEAAVSSIILFAVLIVITFIQFRLSGKWVNYNA